MKKGKLLVLGLIALMLAGGLVLASCGDNSKCPNKDDGLCYTDHVCNLDKCDFRKDSNMACNCGF